MAKRQPGSPKLGMSNLPNTSSTEKSEFKDPSFDPEKISDSNLLMHLESETDLALQRVYQLEPATPMDSVELENGCALGLKREDLSQVHSYKWRGSFNKILSMHDSGFTGALVAASAGNHAQGVAITAKRLQLSATIFMPRSTPLLKQDSVRHFGGDFVDIRLHGDSFDQASTAARQYAAESGGILIPPYDDLQVIAGQSTIGVEIADELTEPPTHVFLEIGGGGMAAGVASVIKRRFPNTKIIAVEAEHQNCMGVSIANQKLTKIENLDRFCDGTAVACPGKLPFRICKHLLDECLTVSNDQVCEAIQFLWQKKRTIVEPSAALGVAAALQYELEPSDRPLTVLSGSNVDFMMLPKIARRGQARRPERRYYAFELDERKGAMNALLDNFLSNMNIIDFQYGKVTDKHAYPVIGIEVPHADIAQMETFHQAPDVPKHLEVTGTAAADFRVIPFNVELLNHPFFAVIEFPNRPGALRDFMRFASQLANVCYMNYTDTGQTEGQALMGFEFDNIGRQSEFLEWLKGSTKFQAIPMAVVKGFHATADPVGRWSTLQDR
ncbi:MAG: pyridoxal-phosphate dependent enzyme [Mariniblastus sp.]|nr:pyridoxal-phosphate dependent enzyme [Mariniblastus sp.]